MERKEHSLFASGDRCHFIWFNTILYWFEFTDDKTKQQNGQSENITFNSKRMVVYNFINKSGATGPNKVWNVLSKNMNPVNEFIWLDTDEIG